MFKYNGGVKINLMPIRDKEEPLCSNTIQKTFNLIISISPQQKQSAIESFKQMNTKLQNMFEYIENKDTLQEDREKYSALSITFIKSIGKVAQYLIDMGVTKEEIQKYCKF